MIDGNSEGIPRMVARDRWMHADIREGDSTENTGARSTCTRTDHIDVTPLPRLPRLSITAHAA